MASSQIIGLATTLGCNETGSNVNFVAPVNITVPSYEVQSVETTNLSSASGIKTYIPGLFDPGKFSFSMQYEQPDWTRLITVKGVVHTWKIVIPTDGTATSTISMSAFLVKAECEVESDKIIMIKGEVQIAGAITVS